MMDEQTQGAWRVVEIEVPEALEDILSGVLWELGVAGVEIEPADPGQVRLRGYVPPEAHDPTGPLQEHLERHMASPVARPVLKAVAPVDWVEQFKRNYRSTQVTDRILVIPSWERDLPVPPGILPLYIDPGAAFGTGKHETTRLVLRELEVLCLRRQGGTLLDAGCGTGIVSIAGLLLGLAHAVAVDLDPIATQVALENATTNQVNQRLEIVTGPIEEITGTFDIVISNMLLPALLKAGPTLLDALRPQGFLVISGFLSSDVERVEAAFATPDTIPCRLTHEGEWACLLLRRPGKA